MKMLSLLVFASLSIPCFADKMAITCSGNASSGNRYRINFTVDESRASFTSPSGTRILDLQNVELEQFNSNGKRVSHHIETLNDFFVIPPSLEDPGQYSFHASGKQSIVIVGFGGETQILKLDVGRFRGIELSRAECKINGRFVNQNDYQDRVDELTKNAQKIIEESQRRNQPLAPKSKPSTSAQ